MKITMIVENTTSNPKIKPEHGLSAYIETEKHKILFDIGSDDLFLRNAQELGIDLREVDTLVISHGHYDHAKGLLDFMSFNKNAKIYIRKTAFEPHFIKVFLVKVNIGLSFDQPTDPRIVLTDDVHRIDDELLLFSDLSGSQLLSESRKKLLKKEMNRYVQDDFSHEQNLLITEKEHSVLLAGCAHNGIYNIFNAAHSHCENLSVCIGGFHLFNPPTHKYESKELIETLAQRLNDSSVQFYTCHCTGKKAYEIIKKTMGEKISYMSAGMSMEL